MPAVLFGSLSTIADTSELQRKAFNDAFAQHGLDWNWDLETYRGLLGGNGGQQRIADFAAERDEDVDAAAVHATKSQLFQASLADAGLQPRPGVAETGREARAAGEKVALVTTTSRANIDALFDGLGDSLSADDFDLILDTTSASKPKPDAAVYEVALADLGVEAGAAVAIEDNVGGVSAAEGAGIATVAFPNENTETADFGAADARVDSVSYDELKGLAASA